MGKPLPLTLRLHRAVAESSMPSDARHLVHVLAVFANSASGIGWRSQATLARLTGLSERHVRGIFAELERRTDWPVRVSRRRRGREGGLGRNSDEWRLELVPQPAQGAASGGSQPAPHAGSDGSEPVNLNRHATTAQPARHDSSTGTGCRGSFGVIDGVIDGVSDCESPTKGPPLALTPPSTKKAASRKTKKPKAANGEAHSKVVAFYFETFEQKRGSKPVGFGGAEGRAVATLLEKCRGNVDEACKVITGAFESWKGNTVTIRQIASNPSEFVGAQRSTRLGPLQTAPAGYDPFAAAEAVGRREAAARRRGKGPLQIDRSGLTGWEDEARSQAGPSPETLDLESAARRPVAAGSSSRSTATQAAANMQRRCDVGHHESRSSDQPAIDAGNAATTSAQSGVRP